MALYLLLIESRRRAIEMAAGAGDWMSGAVYEGRSILRFQDDNLVLLILSHFAPMRIRSSDSGYYCGLM